MKAECIQACISRSSQQVERRDYLPLLGIGEPTSGVLCPVLDSSVQARHQHIGESQLDDMDAEACDICPKDMNQQSKVSTKEIPMTKRFPHAQNKDY